MKKHRNYPTQNEKLVLSFIITVLVIAATVLFFTALYFSPDIVLTLVIIILIFGLSWAIIHDIIFDD